MPRKAINFQNTIIYKIVCKDLLVTQCYVGHTTDFTNRKRSHKCACNNSNNKDYNMYVYTFIRENGGFENFDMIEVEKYPCLDVNGACKRERYWIETLNAELNQVIPTRTTKEYYKEHIEHLKEYHKKWYEENRDEYNKKRRENKNENNRKQREYRALKKANANKDVL
jgi:hypothetical protein